MDFQPGQVGLIRASGFEKVILTVIWRIKWFGGVGGKWEEQRRGIKGGWLGCRVRESWGALSRLWEENDSELMASSSSISSYCSWSLWEHIGSLDQPKNSELWKAACGRLRESQKRQTQLVSTPRAAGQVGALPFLTSGSKGGILICAAETVIGHLLSLASPSSYAAFTLGAVNTWVWPSIAVNRMR